MGLIDAVSGGKNFKRKDQLDELLSRRIGAKLPKKWRKKLRWKKTAPLLSALIAGLLHLVDAILGDKSQPANTAKKRSVSGPVGRPKPAVNQGFSDSTLQAHVDRALAYQAEVDSLARKAPNAMETERMRELAGHMQAWTGAIIELARRVDGFQQNKLISRDLKEVPPSIAGLEAKLAAETNPVILTELERTLANRRKQLASLEKLQQTIEWAEIKIESTLSLLGTMYSQILAGQSKDHVAGYRRMMGDIDEEVAVLQDHLEALEEVKLAEGRDV